MTGSDYLEPYLTFDWLKIVTKTATLCLICYNKCHMIFYNQLRENKTAGFNKLYDVTRTVNWLVGTVKLCMICC